MINSVSSDSFSDSKTIYHYHKLEIIQPKPEAAKPAAPHLMDKVRQVVANFLILLGGLMAFAAAGGLIVQSLGLLVTTLPTLLIPSIAAILTGFQLSKNDLKAAAKYQISTGIPGLSFYA